MDPEQVHNVAFNKPAIGKRGYNEDEVDAFLDFLEAALRDPARGALTVEQIRSVAFSKPPIGKRGYNEDEVDAFLERVAQQLGGPPPGAAAPASGDKPPTSYSLQIRPNLFLFWTPRRHDWSSDGSIFLWDWFLSTVWAAIAWLLEACGAVVLAPVSLLASLLGVRRHQLVAAAKDGSDDLLLSQGSWYAVRRARADAWDQIAAGDGVLTL